jgi:indoleamine 2,3-dioxygenase
MEYAGSYALYNYRLQDKSQGMEYSNLRLIRAFEHGLDPASSEAGFVLVHVAMVKDSGALVSGALEALSGCEQQDRQKFDLGLAKVVAAMIKVNKTMNGRSTCVSLPMLTGVEMWNKSKPRDYTTFRTFIFGIANQTMFPKGVVYEGVSTTPMFFRGESGANDSMVSCFVSPT